MSQLLCLLLALLLALAGGPLSLCACGAGSHGSACEAPAATPSCCQPPPPACCSAAEELPEELAVEPAGVGGSALRSVCACPELDLSLPAAEVAPSSSQEGSGTCAPHSPPVSAPTSAPSPLIGAELPGPYGQGPPPDPGALPRRHLLLHVLRH